AAGEASKDQLRVILEEAAQTKAARGSIDQLAGDFYASCMDESRIDKLGIEPLRPLLADIRKIQTREDLQRMLSRLHQINVAVPFLIYGDSDDRNPNEVIVQIYAAGLGLPDR